MVAGKNRIIWLVILFSVSCLTTSFLAILILYEVSLQQTKARLTEVVQTRASLMELNAKGKREQSQLIGQSGKGSELLTISELQEAYQQFSGMGITGEFTLV